MAKHSKAKNANQQTGQVRIIAGKHRGRKLPVLMADGLRPTTDRVKETVFNWLMPYVVGARCLDCFAGSGSLGFEAVSRGAQSLDFFELNKKASQQLQANITLLKESTVKVFQGDCLALIKQQIEAYDLVFIDPPFRKGLVSSVITQLTEQQLLKDDAVIYVETEAELADLGIPANWQLLKEKVAGQVAYRLYQCG